MSESPYSRRPPWPHVGQVLEYIGGPKDGERCEMLGVGREVFVFLSSPAPVFAADEEPPPFAPAYRVGIYEVAMYGRGYGKTRPPDWFYALKWAGER